jgi:cell fate (sporulation/competence/biofilm development) regulator YmcA (YheA/YmcA/DUF963 family)
MGRNRLAEMQSNSKYVRPGDIETNAAEDGGTGLEMQPLKTLDKDLSGSTVDFFETFEENVVSNIDRIRKNVAEVKVLQKKILTSLKVEEKDAAENRMNEVVAENKRLSRIIQVRTFND